MHVDLLRGHHHAAPGVGALGQDLAGLGGVVDHEHDLKIVQGADGGVVDQAVVVAAHEIGQEDPFRRGKDIPQPEVPQEHEQGDGRDQHAEGPRQEADPPAAPPSAAVALPGKLAGGADRRHVRAFQLLLFLLLLTQPVLGEGIQVLQKLARALITLLHIRAHGLERDRLQLLRDLGDQLPGRHGLGVHVLDGDLA